MSLKAARIEKARRKFFDFVKYMKPEYEFSWHHELLANELQDWYEGRKPRLIVELPPGHAKSEYCSRLLPAWILGKEPSQSVVGASYSEDLTALFKRAIVDNMELERYAEVFPETKISTTVEPDDDDPRDKNLINNALEFQVAKHKGGYKAAGVGGALTGRRAKFLILDDPFKNEQEADSKTVRDARWGWFTTVFMTRMIGDESRVLIVTTRWHKDDIVGRIEEAKLEGWNHVRLPALMTDEFKKTRFVHKKDLREVDEVLWPTVHSPKLIEELKRTQGSRRFSAVYQQSPTIPEGALLKREQTLKRYKVLPNDITTFIQSWDCTFKDTESSDYVVGGVWGKRGGEFFLIYRIREKLDIIGTIAAIEAMTRMFPKARKKIIEEKANGAAVITMLKKKVSGLVPYNPTESKVARFNSIIPLWEAGNVWLPDSSIAPWIDNYVEELLEFPNGSNDDQVDFTSQALIELDKGNDAAFKAMAKM